MPREGRTGYYYHYGGEKTLDLSDDSPQLRSLLDEAARLELPLVHALCGLGEVPRPRRGELLIDVTRRGDQGSLVTAVLRVDGDDADGLEPVLFLGSNGHGVLCAERAASWAGGETPGSRAKRKRRPTASGAYHRGDQRSRGCVARREVVATAEPRRVRGFRGVRVTFASPRSFKDAMNARRFLIAVAATGATSLTAPLIASAGTVRIDASAGANVLRYVADAGEYNELFIALQSGRFTIQDGTSGTRDTLFVAAEAPCERDTTPQPSTGLIDAYCPPAGVEAIAVGLGDGDDSASIGGDFPATLDGGEQADRLWGGSQADDLRGGPGNDTLTGNGGRDRLSGGDGDDTIEAADGLPDEVSCGWGYDTVKADAADSVADDCELNTRQEQPATPPQAVQPPRAVQAPQPIGPPQRTGMRVEQAPTLGGVQRRGLRAEVSCTAACIAQTQLLLPTLARPNTRRRRLLGSGRVKLEAAGRASLVTHLRPGAARRIRRVGQARLTLRTIVRLDAETTVVIQRRVTLR